MLKKTITYTDFNGNKVTEDYYFHLSQAEMVELEMSHKDGLSTAMQKLIDAEDGMSIVNEFKKIILAAYGVKSEDGKRFIKNQELRDDFASSEAYSVLFMELITDSTGQASADFVNGIIPTGLSETVAGLEAQNKPKTRVLSRIEADRMSRDELFGLLQRGEAVLEEPFPREG